MYAPRASKDGWNALTLFIQSASTLTCVNGYGHKGEGHPFVPPKWKPDKVSARWRSVLDVLPGGGGSGLGDWTGWNDTITWQVIMNGWCPVRLWWQPNQRGSLHFTPHLWWNGAERADRLTDVLHTLFIDLADCQAAPPPNLPNHHHNHTHTHTPSQWGKGMYRNSMKVWKLGK